MPLATKEITESFRGRWFIRYSDASLANTAITVSSVVGRVLRILYATVTYSGAASVSVLITLNSGAGAAYDNLLQTIVLSAATDALWIPDEEFVITDDDVLDVLAPAVVGVTARVAIYAEVL